MTSFQTWLTHPLIFEAVLFSISVIAGIFGAILGLGGGIVIVPCLTLLFGVHLRYAIGASIISVIATSSASAAAYVRNHMTNIRIAMFLEIATSLGALLGAVLSTHVPQRLVFLFFSLLLFYSASMMFRKQHPKQVTQNPPQGLSARLRLSSAYPEHPGKITSYTVNRAFTGFILMLGAGVISALLGIGSGVLKVPAMDMAMGIPLKVSSATSNFMIGVTAATSAGTYFMRGDILPVIAAPVCLGVLVGATLGTKIMVRLPTVFIRKIFVVVLLLVAVQMGLKAL